MMQTSLFSAKKTLLLFVLLVFATAGAQGQVKSTISGTIKDDTGGVVPGVDVTATHLGTNITRSVVTGDTGGYEIPFLDPGIYRVSAEMAGFKTAVEPGAELDLATKLRVDLTLQVGEIGEEVEVRAAVPLVETEHSEVGGTIKEEQMRQLPLLTRNYQALATLLPTAVTPVPSATGYIPNQNRGNYYQLAGQRGAYTSYTIDGIDSNTVWIQTQSATPSLDSLQEFKVKSHNFSAEQGRGSVQFITTTKSGTNELRGAIYNYNRNDVFNANSFFSNRAGADKNAFNYNQFGANVGGPIRVPGYDGRDQTFFFFAYEGTRFRQSATSFGRFPDPRWLQGDFSTLGKTIYDPWTTVEDASAPAGYTRQPFPGNQIPSNRINPQAKTLIGLDLIPSPNHEEGTTLPGNSNFLGTTSSPEDINFWTVRIDHVISDSDQIYGRYMESIDRKRRGNLVPLSGTNNDNNMHNAMMSEIHTFSPTTVNELRVGYNRGNWFGGQDGSGDVDYSSEVFGFKNIGGSPLGFGLPSFGWSNYTRVGPTPDAPFGALNNTYQISDNLMTRYGNHSIKLGFDIREIRMRWLAQAGIRGNFTFNGIFSQFPGDTATGSPFADFMMGQAQETWGLAGNGTGYFNQKLWGFYLQDDWRVSSELTVNLGLRYEYYEPWNAIRGDYSVFDFVAPPGSCFRDTTPCPPTPLDAAEPGESYYNADRNNWGPRVGLAYSPFGDNRTVIRASYGIFYSPPDATDQVNGALNPPSNVLRFINPATLYTDLDTNDLSKLFPVADITRADFPQITGPTWHPSLAGATLHSVTRKFDDAIIQHWQLTVQREVVRNLLVEVGYVGSHGYHGQRRINYNQAHLDPPGITTPFSTRLPYPDLSNFTFIMEHSAQNNYNAGLVRLERRFDRGLSFISSYTFARTLDDYGNLNDATGFWAQNSYDKKAEKGLSQFHAKHRLSVGYIWELPVGRSKRFASGMHPVINGVLGGWQLSGIVTLQSGSPRIIRPFPQDFSNTGQFWWATRPNKVRTGQVKTLDPHTNNLRWFDTNYFANPELGTFGNTGRGEVLEPGINNLDLNISKSFYFGERARVQFRAEFYNAFNHTQFFGFGNSVGSSNFGVISASRPPRNIQLGLRLEF
jgi:outer membrane receptor protein involved in Fe transport